MLIAFASQSTRIAIAASPALRKHGVDQEEHHDARVPAEHDRA